MMTSLAATAAGVVLFALPASAHVTIDSLGTVAQGSFTKLGFSVPNERDHAGTVSVKVQMPQDSPLAFVSVQPKTGWDVATTTRNLDTPVDVEGASVSEVVDTITWTATAGNEIAAGQFEEFWISAGTMPTGVDSLSFPTVQTYSDAEEVAWIEPQAQGQPEPEHPVPTVQLVAAGSGDVAAGSGDDADDNDYTLAIVALVVGALGLIGAVT